MLLGDIPREKLIEILRSAAPVTRTRLKVGSEKFLRIDAIHDQRLEDCKAGCGEHGTGAVTRVMIESTDSEGNRWSTVGVSANVIDASYNALHDAITYKLYRDGAKAK